MKTIYCHGLPGSCREIETLVDITDANLLIVGPNNIETIKVQITSGILQISHVIGFSLGAMTALEIAATHPEAVPKLTLIAPAAPLELGNFLPNMAGRAVFRAAQRAPVFFRLFTFCQNLAAKIAPQKILQAMFKDSPPADTELLADPVFQAGLRHGLTHSLGKNAKAYTERVCRYVRPWGEMLGRIQCPVTIHHGEADNWAPIAMSHALKKSMHAPIDLMAHPMLGHYSTLHKVLPGLLSAPRCPN